MHYVMSYSIGTWKSTHAETTHVLWYEFQVEQFNERSMSKGKIQLKILNREFLDKC